MALNLQHTPIAPSDRIIALSVLLALIGAAGIIPLFADSRVEPALLALPIALGLLTRGEFWRKAAFVYGALNAAIEGGVVAFLLRILARQPAATATGWLAPRDISSLSNVAAMALLSFTFVILSQPKVKALFHPFRTSPGV